MFLTFTNAVLLIGLAGAIAPLVLHLLSRARYQSVDWGAMLFLEGLEARQQYNGKINQFLLLALRMALVSLLALALAQPVLQQWSPEADSAAAALRVANRGELLCIGGAIAAAAVVVGMILMTARSARAGVAWPLRSFYLVLAIAAGLGVVVLARRASAWNGEVRQLIAQQQPQSKSRPADGSLHPRIDAGILLDCSPGMSFEENGHTRFSLAQVAAKQVLAGLHRGDRVSLVLLGQHESIAETDPTADLQSVADRIDAARLGRQPADLAGGLLKAQEALDRAGGTARDIYLVCDRRASDWAGVSDYFISQTWPKAVARSGAPVRLFFVPVGGTDSDNIAVEDVRLADPPAIVAQPAEVNVDVHNYGSTARAAVPLVLSVNGQPVFDTLVSVAAGRVAHVSVPVKSGEFAAAGPQVVTAEVRSTGYRDDDRFEAVVEAIDPIRVLVISGDETDAQSPGQFRNESDFLRLALAPQHTLRHRGNDPCKVEVMPADKWLADVDLTRYQVVILANIERFTAAQSRDLEQFVYGGGGLLVAPGGLSRVSNYNDQLWREGAGILPAELEDATPADGAEATTIVGYDSGKPVFRFLHDQPDLPLTSTIGRYFPLGAHTSDAQTLAWYTSGAPFLMESHAGRGKVLLMTTSLDADWSTLPLSSFYLPYVQSAVRYLATGTLPSHNLVLGEPIEAAFDDPAEDRATIESPDGDQRQVPLSRYGTTADLRYTEMTEPGIYRVRVRERTGERTMFFAVHAPREASDLTQLTDARMDDLERGLHLRRIDSNERSIATAVAGAREGIDLWPWAVGAVLILGLFELGLARRWSKDAY